MGKKLKGSVVDSLGRYNWFPQFRHQCPELAAEWIRLNRELRRVYERLREVKMYE